MAGNPKVQRMVAFGLELADGHHGLAIRVLRDVAGRAASSARPTIAAAIRTLRRANAIAASVGGRS